MYPLTRFAVMWLDQLFSNAHVFLGLLSRADRYFRHHRPDAVVVIDYPGFHWWLARRAHFHGVPVFYFVPPQLWGWAGWRVEKMRRYVDHVLCCLPFESAWYAARGVTAQYVGHPYFDELPQQKMDEAFVAGQRDPRPYRRPLAGLTHAEVEQNLGTLLRTASLVNASQPDTRFLVACYKEAHRDYVMRRLAGCAAPVEVHVGRTPEIIRLSHACVAVSGSVGLELLYHGKPTAVVYRISKLGMFLCGLFKKSKYISLVNLLAEAELFPEFLSTRCEADAISRRILEWLGDAAAYAAVRQQLAALRQQVAQPGACQQAAQFILGTVGAERKAAA